MSMMDCELWQFMEEVNRRDPQPHYTEPNLTRFTEEEKAKMHAEIDRLEKAGQKVEAMIIRRRLPISPYEADCLKIAYGIKGLIESGCNLTEAVDRYGEEWLKE